MSGVSPNHARVERNLMVKLSPRAFERGCEVYQGVELKAKQYLEDEHGIR